MYKMTNKMSQTGFILIIKTRYQEQKQNLWNITLTPTSIFNHKRVSIENDFNEN